MVIWHIKNQFQQRPKHFLKTGCACPYIIEVLGPSITLCQKLNLTPQTPLNPNANSILFVYEDFSLSVLTRSPHNSLWLFMLLTWANSIFCVFLTVLSIVGLECLRDEDAGFCFMGAWEVCRDPLLQDIVLSMVFFFFGYVFIISVLMILWLFSLCTTTQKMKSGEWVTEWKREAFYTLLSELSTG